MKTFAAQDKHARYTLEYDAPFILATVVGSIGESVTQRFCRDFRHIVESLPEGTMWAYLCDMSECDGYTGDAERFLVENSNFAKRRQCMVDAYVITSPLAKEQIRRTRIEAHIPGQTDDHVFENIEEAKSFSLIALNHFKDLLAEQKSSD